MPTMEEMRKYTEKYRREREDFNKKREELRFEELKAKGIKPFDESKVPPKRCDHPNTMEDSTATLVWIVAMIVSLLFKGGWVLCIIETIVWFQFITRYKK